MGCGASRHAAKYTKAEETQKDDSDEEEVGLTKRSTKEVIECLQKTRNSREHGESTRYISTKISKVDKHAQEFGEYFASSDGLEEYRPLVEFLQTISSPSTTLTNYLATIISEVLRVIDADRCSIFFVDEVRKEVWCVGSLDMEPLRMPWDQGIVGLVAHGGKLLNLADAHDHESFDPSVEKMTGYSVKSLLSLPVKHSVNADRTIGVIQVLNKTTEPRHFSESDVRELQKIAMLISDSFHRQRWVALEYAAALGDQEALSLLERFDKRQKLQRQGTMNWTSASAGVGRLSHSSMGKGLPDGLTRSSTRHYSPIAHVLEARASSRKTIRSEGTSMDCVEEEKGMVVAETTDSADTLEKPCEEEPSEPTAPLTRFARVPSKRRPDLAKARSLDFSALELSAEELVRLVPLIMEDAGCIESCNVQPATLQRWSSQARSSYRDNPFHSWFHGFSVFQFCYFQLHVSTSPQMHLGLRNLDVFALLIAGLCHDFDHPGFTNSYLIDEESEIALRYNDVSVLENHHASLASSLLRSDGTRIASGMNQECQKSLRRMVIRGILDTDMSHHNDLIQRILGSNNNADCPEDYQFVVSATLHSSDLSGQVLPWKVASQWEERISREFAGQAAAEWKAGRTPAPFMQFEVSDVRQRGKLQRDFIDFVLVPLWGPYADLVPALADCYANLIKNRELYDKRSTQIDSEQLEEAGSE